MTTTGTRACAILSALLFSFALTACGAQDTRAQECEGEPCLEGSSDGFGVSPSHLDCGDQSNCEPEPDPEEPGTGGTSPDPAKVQACVDTWLYLNNLNKYGDPKDTLYASFGPLCDVNGGGCVDRIAYVCRKHTNLVDSCGCVPLPG